MTHSLDNVLVSDQLPSLQAVAIRIIKSAQEPEPDIDEIVRVIKADPAICAKLLKTVNSAIFGFNKPISSIEFAVPILGVTLVKTIVLSFSLSRYQSPCAGLLKTYQRHWRRSLIQAVAAESIASETHCGDPAVFFIVGLLQDIGELALLSVCHEDYPIYQLLDDPTRQCQAEISLFGFSHVDVGVELCHRWGFDDELVVAVGRHHKPFDAQSGANWPALAKASFVAARCANYLEAWRLDPDADRTAMNRVLQETFAFGESEIDDILFDIPLRVGEMSATFSIDIGEAPSNEEILDSAKTMLESLAIQGQVDALAAQKRVEIVTAKLCQLEAQREQLRKDANLDPLTGAYNRRFMDTAMRLEMQQCVEHGSSMGVLFVDIDDFKHLNDTYGHAVGDDALTTVSRILHQSTRDSDLVIRYGGDEFLVILIDVTFAKMCQLSDRVCQLTRNAQLDGGTQVTMSSSVGGVYYDPTSGTSLEPEALFREVDRAMYEAKRQGRDRAYLYRLSGGCATAQSMSATP